MTPDLMISVDFEKYNSKFSDPRVLQNGAGPYVFHGFVKIHVQCLEPQWWRKMAPDRMFSMDLVKWMSINRNSTVMQNGAGPYVSHGF